MTRNLTDTTLVLLTLAEFLTKLEATKTKTAKKYQIPIDNWQLITAYVAQLQKNHCHTIDMTDNVTALGLAITQLSSTISKCLDSIEDQLEFEPPLEPINYATAAMQLWQPQHPPVITWIWTQPLSSLTRQTQYLRKSASPTLKNELILPSPKWASPDPMEQWSQSVQSPAMPQKISSLQPTLE